MCTTTKQKQSSAYFDTKKSVANTILPKDTSVQCSENITNYGTWQFYIME